MKFWAGERNLEQLWDGKEQVNIIWLILFYFMAHLRVISRGGLIHPNSFLFIKGMILLFNTQFLVAPAFLNT